MNKEPSFGDITEDIVDLPALPPLELKTLPLKGRGVFTQHPIPKNTLVSVSPILLFPHDEYQEHGQYTRLDDYTYRWPGGYALTLGLGSMFNHEPFGSENVGFIRDTKNSVIRYFTTREIKAGEELCICYGQNVWFEDHSKAAENNNNSGNKSNSDKTTNDDDDDDDDNQDGFLNNMDTDSLFS